MVLLVAFFTPLVIAPNASKTFLPKFNDESAPSNPNFWLNCCCVCII